MGRIESVGGFQLASFDRVSEAMREFFTRHFEEVVLVEALAALRDQISCGVFRKLNQAVRGVAVLRSGGISGENEKSLFATAERALNSTPPPSRALYHLGASLGVFHPKQANI